MASIFEGGRSAGGGRGSIFATGDTSGSIAGGLLSAGVDVLGGVGAALDFARRTRDVIGHQLGDALYSLGTLSREGEIGVFESIKATETGEQLLRSALPEVFGAQREFEDLHGDAAWWVGLGHEILTDPLNLAIAGGLTKSGRAATKTGQLALGFGAQGAAEQRALLQVIRPTLKGGRIGITRTTLIKGPRAVAALGRMGNWLQRSRPYSWFSTELANPFARSARQTAEAAGAQLHSKLLAHSDSIEALMKNVAPDVQDQVVRAAEHIGLPGEFHQRFLRDLPDEVLDLAGQFKAHVDSSLDLAQTAGLKRPELGGEINNMLYQAGREGSELSREYGKLAREVADGLKNRNQRDLVASAAGITERAATAQDDAIRAADIAEIISEDGRFGTPEYWNAVKKSNRASVEARRLEAKASQVRWELNATLPQKIGPIQDKFAQQFQVLKERVDTLTALKGDVPNYIPREFTEQSQQFILDNFSTEVRRAELWTDRFSGLTERHFATRYDPKTLAEVTGAGSLKDSLLRPASVSEVQEMMDASLKGGVWTGGRMEKYAELARRPDGILDRLVGKVAEAPDVGKVLALEPTRIMEGLNKNIVNSMISKEFMEQMALHPEVFSKTPKVGAGWFHVKELSARFSDQVGDAWVHPDVFRELRKMGSQATVGQRSWIGKTFDQITRGFKWSVTQPWPAYHWRNNFSDFVLMGYNGNFSPAVVATQGAKAAAKKGTIFAGKTLGTIPAEQVNRLARAYGITMGEEAAMGLKGITTFPENARRMGYFVDRLQRGFSLQAAALDVKKVMFDYTRMNAWERSSLRRVIPFYSWMRNNVHLQVQTLLQRPGIISSQLKLGLNVQKKGDVPAWVRGRMLLALDPDDQTGMERYFMGIGLPVEDLMELMDGSGGPQEWLRQLAFRANPLIKLGIGAATGYDIERARTLDRPASAPYLRGMEKHPATWQWLQDSWGARKRTSREGKVVYTIDPAKDFLFRNIGARLFSTVKAGFREPKSTLTGSGLGDTALRFATGYGVIAHDPAETARRERRAEAQSLLRTLKRTGDVGELDIFFARDPELKELVKRLQER